MIKLQRLTPNLSIVDISGGKPVPVFMRYWADVASAVETIWALITNGPLPIISVAVADLPSPPSQAGLVAYASDGRKNGEGAGAGTGVLVFSDATAWRACDTGATVAA